MIDVGPIYRGGVRQEPSQDWLDQRERDRERANAERLEQLRQARNAALSEAAARILRRGVEFEGRLYDCSPERRERMIRKLARIQSGKGLGRDADGAERTTLPITDVNGETVDMDAGKVTDLCAVGDDLIDAVEVEVSRIKSLDGNAEQLRAWEKGLRQTESLNDLRGFGG